MVNIDVSALRRGHLRCNNGRYVQPNYQHSWLYLYGNRRRSMKKVRGNLNSWFDCKNFSECWFKSTKLRNWIVEYGKFFTNADSQSLYSKSKFRGENRWTRCTDQFKIDRVRGIHVQIEIYCWADQQDFDICEIKKWVWFSTTNTIWDSSFIVNEVWVIDRLEKKI